MRVYGLCGSHRMGGNSEQLLRKALDVCESRGLDVEYDALAGKKIGYCTVCDACKKQAACAIDDDANGILLKMASADAIIVASTTYFGSVSGRLSALFDRTLPLRRSNFLLSGKIGGAVAVGGSRNGGQEKVIARIHDWMTIHGMLVVADKKTAHFGGIAVGRNPGDAMKDEAGLETVINLAENIADALARMK